MILTQKPKRHAELDYLERQALSSRAKSFGEMIALTMRSIGSNTDVSDHLGKIDNARDFVEGSSTGVRAALRGLKHPFLLRCTLVENGPSRHLAATQQTVADEPTADIAPPSGSRIYQRGAGATPSFFCRLDDDVVY